MIAPVIDATQLADLPDAVIADVRWYLDGRSGREEYAKGHLPGARFIDLDAHLAGPVGEATGRHPLPTPEVFAEGMRKAGISDDSVVVAYDDAGGMAAGRLVWLLRMLGVDAALLDGGLTAWAGEPDTSSPEVDEGTFVARPWLPADLATIDDASTHLQVLDARAPQRYAGETEPIDPKAGHIPGALNAPFTSNLGPDGRFLSPEALRDRFAALGVRDAAQVVSYCGSGVTACHNLIAMEYAGLGRGRLFPGSWSQYAATERPVATGPEPGSRPAMDPTGVILA